MKALMLALAFFSVVANAEEKTETVVKSSAASEAASTVSAPSELRARHWSVDSATILSLTLGDHYRNITAATSDTETQQYLFLMAGYNFGWIEAGPIFELYHDSKDNVTDSITEYGAYLRANFIENKPGNDLIPYVRLDVRGHSEDISYPNGTQTNYSLTSTRFEYRAGVEWFPFSQILAIGARLREDDRTFDRTVGASTSWKGLFAETNLNIYF